MRTDANLSFRFLNFFHAGKLEWARPETGASQSGHEIDHLFLSFHGQSFADISGISGADSQSDGRSFVTADLDHDGWQDIAVVNSNPPLLQVYRNRIGEIPGRPEAGGVGLRFVGGNRTPEAHAEWSNRNGYGAIVMAWVGGAPILREHRCGEGLAAQNSATLWIGVDEAATVDRLVVRWPSGKVQEMTGLPAGSLVTVYEDVTESPNGTPFVWDPHGSLMKSPGRAAGRAPGASSLEEGRRNARS